MANTVQGKNIIYYMKVDGVYYPVFCSKTMRFSHEQDELETTNITSGSSRAFKPGMANSLVETSGVTTSDNTNGRISVTYLQQTSVRRQIHEWKIVLTDDSGGVVVYVFSGFIRSLDFDKSIPGFSNSNLSVRITGDVEVTAIDPPDDGGRSVYADYWIAVAGQNYIDGASSGNTDGTMYTLQTDDELLGVAVEGQPFYLITSGSPAAGQPECKFNTTTAVLAFPTTLVFSGGERVYVIWERT